MNLSDRNRKTDWLLLFILVVAAILRFYGFPNIPFMYDELSAWSRTNFSSFSELIDKGVRPDGHPAGVQVFIYYWRKLFGDSEASFKLPFLILGLLSVWLVFKIGNLWFNHTVGYVSSAFMAVLQFPVMYSQEERPYASGLFFLLGMVWCWSNYFFSPQKKFRRSYLAGYTLFATLCFYDHYFCMLQALIVGVSGLFFVNRKIVSDYIVANLVVLLLFLPHFGITLDQLSTGGIGAWLNAPTFDFFWNYMDYATNFSWWVKGIILILILTSFYFSRIPSKQEPPFRSLSFMWLMIPIVLGYVYSVWRNPVLQYSDLLFSFPFLFFFLFSTFRSMSVRASLAMVIAIMLAGIYSLVFTRQHYKIFYHQPVEQLTLLSLDASKNSSPDPCLILMSEPRHYVGYYLDKYHSKDTMIYWDELSWDMNTFRHYLEKQQAPYLVCANLPSDYVLQAREFYPYELRNAHGLNYDFYYLSNKPSDAPKAITENILSDSLSAMSSRSRWTYDVKNFRMDSSLKKVVYHMDSMEENGPSFTIHLDSFVTNDYNRLNVIMRFKNVSGDSAALGVQFISNDKPYFIQNKSLRYFTDSAREQGTALYSMGLRDIEYFKHKPGDVRVFVSNKGHEAFDIETMRIELHTGNPWVYGIFEPIPK